MDTAVAQGDVLEFECDVLVLKHAGTLYRVDRLVVDRLEDKNVKVRSRLPRPAAFRLVASKGAVGAANVLFVGLAVTSLAVRDTVALAAVTSARGARSRRRAAGAAVSTAVSPCARSSAL